MLRGAEGADIASCRHVQRQGRGSAQARGLRDGAIQIAARRRGSDPAGQHRQGRRRSRAGLVLARAHRSAEAEAAIAAALRKDADEHVREQAIFALSQLPDERATRALIAAAEDRALSREQRKRAVFWLAQSESAAAQAYLEKVLVGTRTD